MDLRQLRYFVAVAEELHFSRAAVRLNLAQSALSAQIRQLEAELGGPLLVRSTRKVELTPAGESLLEDARRLLALADDAMRRARALARGEAGSLVIGSLGPAPGGVLAPVLAIFSSRHPDVRVELRAFDFTQVVSGLRERRADLAFLYEPVDEPDFESTPLFTERRVVVLPKSHPLADRDEIRPSDLVGETFVTQPDCVPQRWRDFWLLVDELGGRPPVSPLIGDTLEEWLHLIGRGEGIDTAPALISRYYAWPEVRFVPLVDAAPATMVLVRRRDSEHPLLEEFTQLAREVSETAISHEATPYAAPHVPAAD
ncbi:MAG TPA: LysR substrate-binding domain-containing protein [Capillimicrobium sp.]|nr:LysR substrate-binding domain-containing protein [Capillimicrobium sp.]